MNSHQTSRTIAYELTAGAFQWEVAPGKTVEAWGFNQQLPGPVLRAKSLSPGTTASALA